MRPLPLAFALSLLASAAACAAPEKDADRAARYAVELERKPLAAEAPDQRQWLLHWVNDTPDYTVTVCDVLTEGQKVGSPYSAELLAQQLFGNVAYQIAHPSGLKDEITLQMAGIESALRTYQALIAHDPTAHVAYLDTLLEKQRAGALNAFMRPIIVQRCMNRPDDSTNT
ncbi:hypothetical protein [Tahibacter soli]|uniref:Uncharacterized protein n=1 Tax=Tahibacter soli TaxID=2983605 RepID=A0A9X4BIP4_9GAMM|nr:hypothetical protein [Tahibacter soli]MDC8014201.1 hypothetical protein [Tahibacter soli]